MDTSFGAMWKRDVEYGRDGNSVIVKQFFATHALMLWRQLWFHGQICTCILTHWPNQCENKHGCTPDWPFKVTLFCFQLPSCHFPMFCWSEERCCYPVVQGGSCCKDIHIPNSLPGEPFRASKFESPAQWYCSWMYFNSSLYRTVELNWIKMN